MAGGMSTMAREELIRAIRSRYRESTKMEKSRILDELAAVVGRHREACDQVAGAGRRWRNAANCGEGPAYL